MTKLRKRLYGVGTKFFGLENVLTTRTLF